MTSANAALRAEGLWFSYGKAPFIQGLTCEFARGKVTSVIGPNGCGKSTLIKLLSGFLRPRSGQVWLGETPIDALSLKERAKQVAVLSQAPRPPAMSVQDLVACGRYAHVSRIGGLAARDYELINHAIATCGLEDFRHHDARHLSGGERQRAHIAMTLAQDTPLIILDEPTTYLDIRACHDIMHLVRRLNEEERKTIVMVIHDLDLALRYSDEIAVMQAGALVAAGGTQQVLHSSAIEHAFRVRLVQRPATPEGDPVSYSIFPA